MPTSGSIMALDYPINNRLRYSTDPNLHLSEHSTREDVRRVRHLVPHIRGIGPKALAIIDAWLEGGDDEKGPMAPELPEDVQHETARSMR